jgi:hypothetical protein
MPEMSNGLLSPRMKEMMGEGEMDRSCPAATRDITLNLKNRGKAIEKASYGPMNPNEPNEEYWAKLASKWDVLPEEVKTMRCGNCAAFNKTDRMEKCIDSGISEDMKDAMDVVEAGDLGFCEIFDFKCASDRTCAAWIVGGPIEDEEEGEEEEEDGSEYEEEED